MNAIEKKARKLSKLPISSVDKFLTNIDCCLSREILRKILLHQLLEEVEYGNSDFLKKHCEGLDKYTYSQLVFLIKKNKIDFDLRLFKTELWEILLNNEQVLKADQYDYDNILKRPAITSDADDITYIFSNFIDDENHFDGLLKSEAEESYNSFLTFRGVDFISKALNIDLPLHRNFGKDHFIATIMTKLNDFNPEFKKRLENMSNSEMEKFTQDNNFNIKKNYGTKEIMEDLFKNYDRKKNTIVKIEIEDWKKIVIDDNDDFSGINNSFSARNEKQSNNLTEIFNLIEEVGNEHENINEHEAKQQLNQHIDNTLSGGNNKNLNIESNLEKTKENYNSQGDDNLVEEEHKKENDYNFLKIYQSLEEDNANLEEKTKENYNNKSYNDLLEKEQKKENDSNFLKIYQSLEEENANLEEETKENHNNQPYDNLVEEEQKKEDANNFLEKDLSLEEDNDNLEEETNEDCCSHWYDNLVEEEEKKENADNFLENDLSLEEDSELDDSNLEEEPNNKDDLSDNLVTNEEEEQLIESQSAQQHQRSKENEELDSKDSDCPINNLSEEEQIKDEKRKNIPFGLLISLGLLLFSAVFVILSILSFYNEL